MSNLQLYLDKALTAVKDFTGITSAPEETHIARLLEEVRSVDEARVIAIAKIFQNMGTFNQLVRDNVEEMHIGERYKDITDKFNSIRDDSKKLVTQLDDGKIDTWERAQNLWMRIRRGTPHDRFEKIRTLYNVVQDDTRKQLTNETRIMDAYIDFRFAVKEAEILAHEVAKTQEGNYAAAKKAFGEAADKATQYKGDDAAEHSRLELARDEEQRKFQDEDRRYQLLKDIAENLTVAYNTGETLVTKLKQTHDVKDQVYRKSITFFTTNEHVFTILDAVYTSQHGLNEATQSLEAMKEGANKGLEDVATMGRELERAALKAGYGMTISKDSVQKLVDSVVSFQEESVGLIEQLRKESTENAQAIAKIVDDGKQRYRAAITKYAAAPAAIEQKA